MSQRQPQALNITIVGAGIAGCLAARVLREHHNVTLLERSASGHELGAAINIGPNGNKILDSLGFDHKKAASLPALGFVIYDQSGHNVATQPTPDLKQIFGADWTFQHRADLWQELYRLATATSSELGIGGRPAKVRWNAEVVDADVDSGDVKLSHGEVLQSDLVVAADGVKSIMRSLVVSDDIAFRTARPSGSSAFRFLMPKTTFEKLNPNYPVWRDGEPASLHIWIGKGKPTRTIVLYPCRDYRMINFGCIVADSMLKTSTSESWSAAGDRDEMLGCYEGFAPEMLNVLRHAENIKLWQLRDQDPLPTYIRGRMVLIGDAAHSMTPHQGQGGTQAIEDGEGLSLFNDLSVDRASVPKILVDFDRVRRPRASRIQDHTREAHDRKSADEIWRYTKYNFTYPGIKECIARLDANQEMIPI